MGCSPVSRLAVACDLRPTCAARLVSAFGTAHAPTRTEPCAPRAVPTLSVIDVMTRIRQTVALALAGLFLTGSLVRAQDDDSRFRESQAKKLHKFAEDAFNRGFPRQAKRIWLQLLKLYDADYEPAREALGETRVGNSWAPRTDYEYPTEDTGTGQAAKKLAKSYDKLKRDLARGHEREAEKFEKAQRLQKAREHWQMVIRWDKTNTKAQEALEHREVGGVTGTDLEQTIYDRSKMIERVVATEARKNYATEPYQGSNAVLDQAQVEYVSVRSEHFILHGDPGQEEMLNEALVWAERALRVCNEAFPWHPFAQPVGSSTGATSSDSVLWESAYFLGKDTYVQILEAHAGRFGDVEWMKENSSTSQLDGLEFGATSNAQTTYDAMVRDVAQKGAGFRTTALAEGIGHTFVGMIFNNNRLFAVDLKQAGRHGRERGRARVRVAELRRLEGPRARDGVASDRRDPGDPDRRSRRRPSSRTRQRIKAWSFVRLRDAARPQSSAGPSIRLAFEQISAGVKVPLKLEEGLREARPA
jgi:hypothetical protein